VNIDEEVGEYNLAAGAPPRHDDMADALPPDVIGDVGTKEWEVEGEVEVVGVHGRSAGDPGLGGR